MTFAKPQQTSINNKPNKIKIYRIEQSPIHPKTGNLRPTEIEIEAVDAFAALGKYRGRGVNGLGRGWRLTRQKDGWIIAVNSSQKTLEGGCYRLKETCWNRYEDQDI